MGFVMMIIYEGKRDCSSAKTRLNSSLQCKFKCFYNN